MTEEGPSKTARKVALNILTLGAKRGMVDILPPGVVDATAELLVVSGAADRKTVHFSRSRLAVSIYQAFDWMMPGQFEAFAYRKAFCEQQVRNGIDAGARQVIVLGAGYDTLGWRLAPEFAGVNFFEIDHPATARLKEKGLDAMGRRLNLHCIAADLGRRELRDVLDAEEIWDSDASTVIVAEGLLMYLYPEAVGTLFEHCAAVTGSGSRMIFTYAGRRANGQPDAGPWSWMVLYMLWAGGEPWLWSIPPEEIGPFLEKHHWMHVKDRLGALNRRGVEFYGVAAK